MNEMCSKKFVFMITEIRILYNFHAPWNFFFQPFKNVKAILSFWAIQIKKAGRIRSLDHILPTPTVMQQACCKLRAFACADLLSWVLLSEVFMWFVPSLHLGFFFFFLNESFFLSFFIFGCVGSLFLCEGFLQLRQTGTTLHRGARASHYRSLSCCGAQAPDAQAQ